ncbi:hypothetical protein PHLGIDRAFT_114476 [Phlebiopsis gigantea 11061_1 CR5-6]|uniref:Uncharacterized protein n=1 Tax=Phlebiopsis gigantea (strain 11061_1 CR5-6) TaxID=745531 RepID=A0A0C3S637_PHLG1|nr:hypothetical protein PHLGIDRAFT_114476 [Phlebiopsis gigantea 11061_1 CR5-6]
MLGTVANAEFAGTLLEAGVYGMYSIKFVQSLWIFYKRRKEGRDVRWFVAAALVIFALVTARLILDVSLVLEAQTAHTDVPGAAAAYYKTISTHRRLARTSIYVVLTLVSDAIIVYRTYVAWGRAWSTALFPFLLFLTDVGLAPWELWSLAQLQPDAPVMKAVIAYHVKYFYLVTLMLNLACTATIACRIWRVHRKAAAAEAGSMRFAGVLAAVVESTAVYTCWLAALMGTSIVRTPNTWVVLDSVRLRARGLYSRADIADVPPFRAQICPVIGIVFSTIIVHSSRDYDAYFEPYSGVTLTEDISQAYSHDPVHYSDTSTLYNHSISAESGQHLDV